MRSRLAGAAVAGPLLNLLNRNPKDACSEAQRLAGRLAAKM